MAWRKSVVAEVEVYIGDFEDEVLIEELEARGYKVQDDEDEEIKNLLQDVIDWYRRGDVKEALFQLERIEPKLYGISEKVNNV